MDFAPMYSAFMVAAVILGGLAEDCRKDKPRVALVLAFASMFLILVVALGIINHVVNPMDWAKPTEVNETRPMPTSGPAHELMKL